MGEGRLRTEVLGVGGGHIQQTTAIRLYSEFPEDAKPQNKSPGTWQLNGRWCRWWSWVPAERPAGVVLLAGKGAQDTAGRSRGDWEHAGSFFRGRPRATLPPSCPPSSASLDAGARMPSGITGKVLVPLRACWILTDWPGLNPWHQPKS